VIHPPAFHSLAAYEYDASRLRRVLETMLGDSDGVVTGLAVLQEFPASMNLRVTEGRAFVRGTSVTRQGVYMLEVPTEGTVAVTAAHATLPRIDRVVLEDLDSSPDGGGALDDLARVRVIAGTPAASPAAPALPANAITLATVQVDAAATSIANAKITTNLTPAYSSGLQVPHFEGTVSGTAADATDHNPPSFSSVTMRQPTGPGGVLWSIALPQRVTIPKDGVYQVAAHVSWNAMSIGSRSLSLMKNGALFTSDTLRAVASSLTTQQSLAMPLYLVAGDYLALRLWQDSTGVLNYTASLRVTRIGG
jgi:hypothetical protein